MPIERGTRLGPYEILLPIGAGGMGEVYRARDTRLDRDVAVKVLPPSLADDPAALARFEREAKSIAQLSHPNIVGIFDVGLDAQTAYAVMELLDGQTLRGRLETGPLSARKAADYGVQIAHGLAAAHDRGTVHRDLKPENLFITRDDRAKILDFGLAKPLDLGTSGATVAGSVGTGVGAIVGTVGYMAPEQVRGLPADHRADVFAFGAVLYEMLSGHRAFRGDSAADSFSAILNAEPPDLDAVAGGVPVPLERIVRRCLEKKPELRFQSSHDLAFALETLSSRTSGVVQPESAPVASASRVSWAWVVTAVALLIAAAAGAVALRSPPREVPWQAFTAITDAAGVETAPALSPDGGTVAYATRAAGSWDIYVQRVGGRAPLAIAADPDQDESGPAFSPDGRLIAYHHMSTRGGIFVTGATGEASRRTTDFGAHPAWSPDGARIVFSTEAVMDPYSRLGDSSLWIVDASGGPPRRVDGTGDAVQPSWSPSGDRIAYWSNTGGQRDIFTISVDGGTRVAVTSDAALDWGPVWSPDGRHLYFASDRGGSMNLWRIAVDVQTGAARGGLEPVTTGVQAASAMPAFSKDGARLAFRSMVAATNPVAIPLDPVTLRAGVPVVLQNSNSSRRPADVSPDGRRLTLGNLGEPQEDIFISARDGSGVRRVTDDAARDRVPVWSADGRSIYFYSNRGGTYGIWGVDVDGGGLRAVMSPPGPGLLYPLVSPKGDRLVASAGAGGNGIFIGSLAPDVAPDQNAKLLPNTRVGDITLVATTWSPDGGKLAGFLGTDGGAVVAIGVYDLGAQKVVRRFDIPTTYVRWLPDSRRLCFFSTSGEQLMVLDTDTGKVQRVEVTLPLRDAGDAFALAPDGRAILYGGLREEADIWIVERK